jgi:subtilase family serine protease
MRADRTCTATFGAGADLIVPVLTVPATAGAGEGTAVTTTVENQGAGVAGASTVRFYLSLDGSLGPGDAELGHGSVPALVGGGGTHTMTTLVAIPAATLAGTYYVFAKADADKAVIETNETNHKKRRPIKIGPDLIIVALSAPATAHAGDTVSIAEATRNKGGGGAGGSSTHLYLSSDPLLDAGDVLLATTAVLPLGPGARSAATISVVLPAGLTAGPYYVIAVADAGGSVPESDENNNTRSQAITLE